MTYGFRKVSVRFVTLRFSYRVQPFRELGKKDGIYADVVLNLFGLCMALDEPGKCEIWQDTGCDGVRYAL